MKIRPHFLSSIVLAAALVTSVFGTACSEHRHYRVYDPYYSDYHDWNHVEVDYYHRWARENHRMNTETSAACVPKSRRNTGHGGTATVITIDTSAFAGSVAREYTKANSR